MEAEITKIPGWRHCGATNTIRHRYTTKGKQRYRCRTCSSRSFVQDPASAAYDPARKEEILGLPRARLSARHQPHLWPLARHPNPLAQKSWRAATSEANAGSCGGSGRDFGVGELWSLVYRRSNKRWIWLALCRRTRQVLAYAIGSRGEESWRLLWERIPES